MFAANEDPIGAAMGARMTRKLGVTIDMICTALCIKHRSAFQNFLTVAGSRPPVIGKIFDPATGGVSTAYDLASTKKWLRIRVATTPAMLDKLASMAKSVAVA